MSSYEEIWKSAQKKAKEGDFKAALAHYLQCEALFADEDKSEGGNGRYLHLQNSIVYAAFKAGNAGEAHSAWLTAIKRADPKTDHGLTSIIWLSSMIPHIESLIAKQGKKAIKKGLLLDYIAGQESVLGAIDRLCIQSQLDATKDCYKKHGLSVNDPFAYLETDWTKDKWLESEANRSDKAISLLRSTFKTPEELQKAGWSQLHRLPHKQGKFFYFLQTILGTRHINIHRSRSLSGHRRLLLDTTEILGTDETFAGYRINKDGKLLAYGISARGSDRTTWRILNLENNKQLKTVIKNVLWGSIYFSPDGKKLYYQRQRSNQEVGHRVPFIATSVASGKTSIFHKPIDKESSNSSPSLVFGEKYILATETRRDSLNTRLFLKPVGKNRKRALELLKGRPGRHIFIGWLGRSIYILTDENAPNKKVLKLTFDAGYNRPIEELELIKESEEPIEVALFKGEELLLLRLAADASCKKLHRYNRQGDCLGQVKTPFAGWIDGLSLAYKDNNLFYGISSRSRARTLIHHDLKTGKNKVFSAPKFKTKEKIKSEIVYARSADGATVPMHISYPAEKKPGADMPCLINVYGGFSHNMFPSFDYQALSWIAMGGMWCQPFLRGGAELGEDWHRQAIGVNKERTFDDALACVRHLIDNGFTSPPKLAIKGSSNGGLTVGVLLTRHAELFGAAIATNGLFDMLKFATHSVGWSWEREYGSVSNKDEFLALLNYSPYHNIPGEKSLPPLLLCVSESDDRVLPWHTFKFAAGIANSARKATCEYLILRIESKRGHSANQPSHIVTDQLAFLHHFLGM